MYQSIALSSEAILEFQEDFSKWFDAIKYLSKEKEILVKSDFTKNVKEQIESVENKQISSLMAATIFPILNRIKPKDFERIPLFKGIKNKDDLIQLGLAEQSENKILITNRKNLDLLLKFNNPESEIDICSGVNYLDPSKNDKVTNPRKIINIQDKDPIDPNYVLFPYIELSKTIKILDPYPPIFPKTKEGKVRALPIWRDFINSCKKGSKIIFTTVSDEQRSQKIGSKYYRLTEEDITGALSADVRPDMDLKFIFSNEKIMGRSIETDYFYIQIEHGLGMFRWNKGYYINNAGLNAHIIITHIGS
jgi:hypothetical protein